MLREIELLLTLVRLRESHGTLPLPLYKCETSSQPLGRIKGGCYIGQNPVMDPFSSSSLLQHNGRLAAARNWSFCTSQYSLTLFFPELPDYRVWPIRPQIGCCNDATSELRFVSLTRHLSKRTFEFPSRNLTPVVMLLPLIRERNSLGHDK